MALVRGDTSMLTGAEFDRWESTYTTVQSSSATYESTFTTVNTNSATWSAGGGGGGSASPDDANLVVGLSLFL